MHQALGAEGIIFSGSSLSPLSVLPFVPPSVRQYVWPTITQTTDQSTFGPSFHLYWEVSGHVLENAWAEWPEGRHAPVPWSPSELILFWSRSVDFPHLGDILIWFWSQSVEFPHIGGTLTYWNRSNLRFPSISLRMHGRSALKFVLVTYPELMRFWS